MTQESAHYKYNLSEETFYFMNSLNCGFFVFLKRGEKINMMVDFYKHNLL